MKDFVESLQAEMAAELQIVASESDNNYQRAEKSYYVVEEKIRKLKTYVSTQGFQGEEDEIYFFKRIKPEFLKELIYFKELYHIEANKPLGYKDIIQKYLNNEVERISSHFRREQIFYNYYRSEKTHFDKHFFLRKASNPILQPEYSLDIDSEFCTVHSFKLSKLMGFEKLHQYLLQSLHDLDLPKTEFKKQLKWTDSKASLLEFIYGHWAAGSIDNGNADVKDIVSTFETALNIDLGNYYAVFNQNIRLRKKNRTAAFDYTKDKFIRYMDELDENPRQQVR